MSGKIHTDRATGTVERVTDDGMTDRGAVEANLVGASGFEAKVNEGVVTEAFENVPVGDGEASPVVYVQDRHLFAIARMASNGEIDCAVFLARGTVNEAEVFALCGFGGDLCLEVLVGEVRFCDDDRAGGVFIEAVNDAGALGSADAGKLVATMV